SSPRHSSRHHTSHDPPPSQTSTLSLHDALPISEARLHPGAGEQPLLQFVFAQLGRQRPGKPGRRRPLEVVLDRAARNAQRAPDRSEEHTSELQSRENLVCRLLLEKKKNNKNKKT